MSEASSAQFSPWRDFSTAQFTAVISDLHLCEAEQVDPRYPLWKKYKTREFFFDETFADFLEHIEERAQNHKVELVLNGDIFDFDSVMKIPPEAYFRVGWLERLRGLESEEEKSVFKMEKILSDHRLWIESLRDFIVKGHSVVFVIGNHDLELHWPKVQKTILDFMGLSVEARANVRFCEWFYISNKDTLIEHGNQYDPYCLCTDPINPVIRLGRRRMMRLPFGNIACRYMINGMGFFNPHVDAAYIMTIGQYLKFFVKYVVRRQPLLVWTWFWGACATLMRSVIETLQPAQKHTMSIEDRVEEVARRSNASARMVRELRELFVSPATLQPLIIMRELWLDRAFLLLLFLLGLLEGMLLIQNFFGLRLYWAIIPVLIFVPFFMFYSKMIRSNVHKYKEPRERILGLATQITKTKRVIYGHTHIVRHEIIGSVEHLNSGCWSPAFLDVECTKPVGQKTFIWLSPNTEAADGSREARLFHFTGRNSIDFFTKKRSARGQKQAAS